ncbi:ergosterol biosynthesis ERG4/ERG24 family-domain-containing protein [Chytridium lagenaria]|nr:ergosterol biosynthesis ERG4/ERG24 family-domain-containing protein [Chytridium lagenaria]
MSELRQRTDSAKVVKGETKGASESPVKKVDYQKGKSWGRAKDIGAGPIIASALIMAICPLLVIYFWRACDTYQCNIAGPITPLAFLYAFLPGPVGLGQTTPAGYTLKYIVNGLLAWFVTHVLYFGASLGPQILGSWIYDLYMGIEFNPRFGQLFDFKLFHNGRPEFTHEDWYLRTIDISHDHWGFYLAWGDSVWLPYIWPYFGLVISVGLFGYYIFRAVNNQKDLVRRTDGKCTIWGRAATVIRTEFETSDGKIHRSLLLTSGFWGVSRHFNYVGDLLISLAMCMTCGVEFVLPYFYIVYMTILLLHRIARDDDRCRGKYGKYWDMYCKAVPYKLLPYIF